MEPNIIFEDNHIIVVIKPAGIPTQADSSGDADLLSSIKGHLTGKFCGLVHRLDRVTGGVMVFAKTTKAAQRLSDQLQKGDTFQKTYHAIVEGNPKKREQTLVDYLVKNEQKNTVQVVPSATKDAKRAELSYKVLNTVDNVSLAEVKLLTGRGHQIRVQMANIGHPILGDVKYSDTEPDGKRQAGIALWAYELSFIHPTSESTMRFVVNPPEQHPWNIFEYDRTVRKGGVK